MSIFTGAGVALVTPMHADGSVNFDKMKELIEFQIANDTVCGIIAACTCDNGNTTCCSLFCEADTFNLYLI